MNSIPPGYILSDSSLPADEVRLRLAEISEDYQAFRAQSRQMVAAIASQRSRL